MNKKKALLTVLAMVLVCVMSVMGTVAYLQASTGAVTNTFVSAVSPDDPFVSTLTLQEYKVEANDAGNYVQGTALVNANDYGKVLPGAILPKTPVITVTGKNDAAGYLFVEVVNTLPEGFTWSVDTSKWLDIGVTGPNGGKVYVYASNNTPVLVKDDVTVTGVLTDNKITAPQNDGNSDNLGVTKGATDTMTFYAYLAQATVGDKTEPADVFVTCWTTATKNSAGN